MPPQQERTFDYAYKNEEIQPLQGEMTDQPPCRQPRSERRESFIIDFAQSSGPPQIVLLVILLALGFGSTIGVVPAVMTDRYARLHHGYANSTDCGDYDISEKPSQCLLGSADAQNAVALEQLVSNILTFISSSLIGSFSDEHGRKTILVVGLSISSISPVLLLILQLNPSMSPNWYYAFGCIQGVVSWITVALSALSDVMPPKWRAPSFGLLLAGFSLGFSMAPQLALLLGHLKVTILSVSMVAAGLLVIIFFFPETLPPETAEHARTIREQQTEGLYGVKKLQWIICRPLWELSILNRSSLFRLLSLLAFFSGMVSSGDRTLLLYYLEDRLGFNDRDVATMFMIMGLLGIFVQGVVLKVLNDLIGERRIVTMCFCLGSLHNLMYGLAQRKSTIFFAVAISSLGGMAFPTISAIKSNNVDESEQGRIQGALFSLQALAGACGPMVLRGVYHFTKDGAFLGPGSMFVVAAGIYLIAVYCAYSLPNEVNSARKQVSPSTTGGVV